MFPLAVNIKNLIDDEKCYEVIRSLRWPAGCQCPHCNSDDVVKRGKDEIQPAQQRYLCKVCGKNFDDLTDTVFSGHRQPLKIWILCLYFMGLNLSNQQVARELDLHKDDIHNMTSLLREGIYVRRPDVILSGEIECDEVYIVAGHKGNPDAVKKRTSRSKKSSQRCSRSWDAR